MYENGVCTCGAEEPEHEHVYENGVCTCGAEEPEHEHVYENGVCTCGAEEPEHEHVYENGVCTCGAEEPEHEHAYENGVCTCGAEEPKHEHVYENGVCTCGATDPVATDPVATDTSDSSAKRSSGLILTSTGPESTTDEWTAGGVLCTLTEDGVFKISKIDNPESSTAGVMCDYATNDAVPWYNKRTSIKTLIVEEGVTALGERPFNNASSLSSISLPSTLTSIGPRCFSNCVSLTSISLPNSVTQIGNTAFNGCTNLTVVNISNTGIETLNEKVFAACSKLTTLSIPSSVKKIIQKAFGTSNGVSTNALTRLNYSGTLEAWKSVTKSYTDNTNLDNGTCTVYCTDGIWANGYTSHGQNMCYKIADGTLYIRCDGEMQDFSQGAAPWGGGAESITTVVLENGITKVGAYAFEAWETISYSYTGNFDELKAASSLTGNTALFGEDETGGEGGEGEDPDDGGEVDENIITGTTGDVTYSLNKTTGVMTLSGTGATASYPLKEDIDAVTSWTDLQADIKEVVVEKDVTSLGDRLFTYAENLEKVTIASNSKLTSIGARCFSNCTKLTSFNFPITLETIGSTAFNNCGFSEVDLSNTKINSLASKTFAACRNLKTITLPVITEIGQQCFGSSSGVSTNQLESVHFMGTSSQWSAINVVTGGPSATVQIDNTRLLECTIHCTDGDFTLNENYDIPVSTPDEEPEENVIGGVKWTLENGVLTISPAQNPEDGFESGVMRTDYENNKENGVPWYSEMSTITTLRVESGVTVLGNRVCNNATALTSVSLPEGLITIGERCFVDCESLRNIALPDTLVDMGAYAFTGCIGLTVVDLSNTKIETLGAKAFAGCKALTTLSIPGTITDEAGIASNVFCNYGGEDTDSLTRLNFGGTLATWNSFTNHNHEDNPNLENGKCTVYCSDGIWNNTYTNAGGNLLYKLENGTLSILCNGAMPDYAEGAAPWFAQASDITAVIFEDGTTTVGANAFHGCVNLTDVTICEGMTKVGENAFSDCENLANVHFYGTDSQWTALQNASGDGNGPLFGITITSGYSGKCGDNARWEYDQEAKTLTISGEGPMWDWNQRTYQNTPWSKFKDEIETIKIGYGITNTGRYAFCYLTALKNLEFETNEDGFTTVETIGGYCFCWYNQLSTLTLPEGVRFISGRAFSRCESIATVYFPSTLESIDMYAFKSEDAAVTINKVYYNGTKEDWERKVFVSAQGDNLDQLFDKDTEWVYQKEYAYYTDVADDAWYKDAVLYLKDQGMAPENGAFGVDDAATMQWVLDALYIRAGSSGAYTDGLDWAKIKNIAPADTTASTGVSLNALADILYRTTLYNGHLADLGDGTALNWCQTYIPEELAGQSADAELTRAQVASVLAAYLQSTNGSANRYDEMRDEMKEAYETSGGDGKMHILALHHAGKGKVGDSTLILLPGGETMLIDTFRNDGWQNYLKATLDSLNIKTLDYLVLSHGHEDHDANLTDVINYIYGNGYTIGNYWSAGSTTSDRETAAINLLEEKGGVNIQRRLRAGQRLTIGSGDTLVTVDILWPMESGIGHNGIDTNDGSLTMKLTYGDSSYLCGGDLFLTAEEDILELYKDNPDILKADVLKTNHHGSYSSNGSAWVGAIDPKALITHSDDTGDSAQCYEYSRDGKAWFTAGRDGGVLVTMDGKKNITVTTGYDTNLRQNVYACGEKGHIYEGQAWEFDENGHWRRCEGFWLCGAMEPVLAHAGGTATCQHGKICETCGFEYTEKGTHNWVYTAAENVITATCGTCNTPGGTLTLEIADTAPVYDGTAKTVTVSGSISGVTTPDVTYEGSRVNAGTFTASIELEDAKAHLSVTIGKRNATVTANDQTIAYGGTISNTEITATGLLDGHSVSATLTPSTAEVTANGSITPGAAIIMADGTDVTNNYSITYVTGKLVIEAVTTEAERNAQAVESTITQLPPTVEPDDEEAAEEILAAKAAYDALAEAEKSLVSDAAKKKLNDLVAALTDYDIIKGDGGKWATGSNGSLSFTANGPFSKFIGIEVDGKKVDEKHYTAKSGSTIITLKQSYLKNLSAGKHTITVLYTDGETDGEFTVQPEATTPATGDSSDIMLWSAVLLLSVMGIALLIGYRKRFAYKGKYVKK